MLKRLISFGLTALTAATLYELSKQLQRGSPAKDAHKPEPVQTWEGEGGALPLTGAHLGPDPAIAQTTTQKNDETQGIVH
jgi:hypothetical protein